MRYLIACLVALFLMANTAEAAEANYVLDNPHTQIFFTVSHMGFSHSTGSFTDYNGAFKFDPEDPSKGSVDVTIHTDSLNMGHDVWEDHMKAEGMFNVAAYPDMKFKSTSVEVTGENTAALTGDLTLLGVTKPVTLNVTKNSCGEHPMSKKPTCGFDATGTLKRSDFGMTKGIPMIGDDVEIRITVEGQVQ